MNIFDRIWGAVIRVLASLLGLWIMWHEAAVDHSDRPWLYAAAVAMMGLPFARYLAKLLDLIGKLGNTREIDGDDHLSGDQRHAGSRASDDE